MDYKILMLNDAYGSPDGFIMKFYKKGETYLVGELLAGGMIKGKSAKLIEVINKGDAENE